MILYMPEAVRKGLGVFYIPKLDCLAIRTIDWEATDFLIYVPEKWTDLLEEDFVYIGDY